MKQTVVATFWVRRLYVYRQHLSACAGYGNYIIHTLEHYHLNIHIYIYYLILKIVHVATQSFMQFRNLQETVITSSVLFVDATHYAISQSSGNCYYKFSSVC